MDLQHVALPWTGGPAVSLAPAKSFVLLGSFSPAFGIERAAMFTQAACNRTSHRPHLLTRS
jgi:hypothetical protein